MAPRRKSTISATEARIHFGEIMRRAENHETLIVARSGQPKVAIMFIESYEQLASERDVFAREPNVPERQKKLDRASELLSHDLPRRR